MLREKSIVKYYGPQKNSGCGYCSSSSSSHKHSMWAYSMTAADYQDLSDRGWVRSGKHCYKPYNPQTCCPCYAIKCDAKTFQLSKSHKKVLRKMNKFLRTGQIPNDCGIKMGAEDTIDITPNQPNVAQNHDNVLIGIETAENGTETKAGSAIKTYVQIVNSNTDANRKRMSCESRKGGAVTTPVSTEPLLPEAMGLRQSISNATDKKTQNMRKTLSSYIEEMPTDGKHKLKITMVPSHDASTDVAFNLYRRYNVAVHNSRSESVTRQNYESFLVHSPLQHETSADGPSPGYGSFHQQYWLDDTLIAVGVIDILPKCVSSVYFFYDPDFRFLSLGTYGALCEIEFVQELNKTCDTLNEYRMGHYVPRCPKIRYMHTFQPSYLLCPEVYTWHQINDDLLELLDRAGYSRLNLDPQAEDLNQFNPATDLDDLRLFIYDWLSLRYKDYSSDDEYEYSEGSGGSANGYVHKYTEYGKLVGKVLSSRLYLIKE